MDEKQWQEIWDAGAIANGGFVPTALAMLRKYHEITRGGEDDQPDPDELYAMMKTSKERAEKAERERDEALSDRDKWISQFEGWRAEAMKAQQERDDARQTMGAVLTDARRFERERDEAREERDGARRALDALFDSKHPTPVPPALIRAVMEVCNRAPRSGGMARHWRVWAAVDDLRDLIRTGDYTSAEPEGEPGWVVCGEGDSGEIDWVGVVCGGPGEACAAFAEAMCIDPDRCWAMHKVIVPPGGETIARGSDPPKTKKARSAETYHPTVVALLEAVDGWRGNPGWMQLVDEHDAWSKAGKPGLPKEE